MNCVSPCVAGRITDNVMPGMDGYELIRRLRGLPNYATIPVIVITSLESTAVSLRAAAHGASDGLAKPFLFMELVTKVLLHGLNQPGLDPEA